jgi:hypothetical protein
MSSPREGMLAVVRNRRALITRVEPFDAEEHGRSHLIDVEYSETLGLETDSLLWELEPGAELIEPASLPRVADEPPMELREFDAMVRAIRWSALTPSLPFSGLDEDRPPLASPLFGAIQPEAYQLVPVLKALQMPRVALLLADAVGLGKTIQAGMVIRELMLRRRIRRILVLCPAALRTQWRDEMQEKFSLPFEVVDRPAALKLQRELGVDASPWRTHERIVASYHYLKQPDVLESFRPLAEPGEDGRLKWDLLVVDEAHNLSPASFGKDSDLAELLQRIAPWFEHRLFLTATPHNGHTRSFTGLLESLDPVRFNRTSRMDAEQRARVGEIVVRRLKSEINGSYVEQGEPPRFSDRHVEALPPLRFGSHECGLLLGLRDFRLALRRAIRGSAHGERTAAEFAVEVLQKRLMSGPWAFGQSWRTLLEGLGPEAAAADAAAVEGLRESQQKSESDDDLELESRQRHAERTVGAWLRRWREAVAGEIAALTAQVEAVGVQRVSPGLEPTAHETEVARLAGRVAADARLAALEALIDERMRLDGAWKPDERLVVFTEYLASLDYLRARLRARYGDGDWLLSLYGGMNDAGRDEVKRRFNDPGAQARVLLATDAAGEGLNLQRCARLLLHWDIPWNPARMEQRNGRLDRHGQERDVFIHHFDSADDASMTFLGKVLAKRSHTREDRIVTDEIFARAIEAHFQQDEDAAAGEGRLDRAIQGAHAAGEAEPDDLPSGRPLPGAEDQRRLDELRRELDLTPDSLRETLETALAIGTGRPRLEADGRGRDRLKPPVPAAWTALVDRTLRAGGVSGPLLALVFDPAHYLKDAGGRPVFVPEPDSRLLHLGDEIYRRTMSTFARYRFPGGPAAATRWIARTGGDLQGADALVLLTVEELAHNELREPCHHWVRTLAFPVAGGRLGEALAHRPAADWAAPAEAGDREAARDLWEDVEDELKERLRLRRTELEAELAERLASSSRIVREQERQRFQRRRRELQKAAGEIQLTKIQREIEGLQRRIQQGELFAETQQQLELALADAQVEYDLRRTHFDRVGRLLDGEERRTMEQVLPKRYRLHGGVQVHAVAVEIRLPGGVA